MIFDKLKIVMKRSGEAAIWHDADGYQWIGTLGCMALASDLPEMEEETLKAVLSIGDKKRTEYLVRIEDKPIPCLSSEAVRGGHDLTEYALEMRLGGSVYRVFRTDRPIDGLILIESRMLAPFADAEGGITMRLVYGCAVVMKGMMPVGAIGPKRIDERIGNDIGEMASLAELSIAEERNRQMTLPEA